MEQDGAAVIPFTDLELECKWRECSRFTAHARNKGMRQLGSKTLGRRVLLGVEGMGGGEKMTAVSRNQGGPQKRY